MLRAGVIEPATAEWASPVVFVPKRMVLCGSVSATGS